MASRGAAQGGGRSVSGAQAAREFHAEWSLWERSLAGLVPAGDLAGVKAADLAAIESGERLAFMPVFYALVRV
jgi:hypothetical protein